MTAGSAPDWAPTSGAAGEERAPRRAEPDPGREATLDEAMELIHFGFRRVVEEADALLAKSGMGRLHHRVLYVVGKNEGIRVLELAELLGVSKQALHGPLGDLRRADLVAHVDDPADGRVRALGLTPTGRAFERRLAALQHACFERAFRYAGPYAERAWRRVMDRLGEGRRLRRAPRRGSSAPATSEG